MPIKHWHRARRRRLVAAPPRVQAAHGWQAWLLKAGLAVALLGLGWLGGGWHARQSQPQPQRLLAAPSGAASMPRGANLESEFAAVLAREAVLGQALRMREAERAAQASELAELRGQLSLQQETLAFFQSLLQANERNKPVSIAVCGIVPEANGGARYRLLLIQGINRDTDFQGRLQLALHYRQDGKTLAQTLPEQALKFRHYGRSDGVISLPAGAGPQWFEARVVDADNNVLASCQQKQGE
ncbi:DUF6776 family protein [Chitinilyticum litopenaei]|uniref:DUF6776 family protein n=1 Tax=Chitinilyticum litopenaei TaxID=1121276 RepID=UPI00041E285F|nr:DUF6776 family protein [Chitinilyticum litopenaei]